MQVRAPKIKIEPRKNPTSIIPVLFDVLLCVFIGLRLSGHYSIWEILPQAIMYLGFVTRLDALIRAIKDKREL